MRLIRLTEEYIREIISGQIAGRNGRMQACALTLGSFDGLHRGHLELLQGVRDAGRRLELPEGAVFTFMRHPRQTLQPDAEPFLLTTWREKLSLLQQASCRVVVAADFCPELSRLGYREFVSRFLVGYLGMKHLVAGYDVHLGADRRGNAATLAELGRELGFTMEIFPPVREGVRVISSSAIRAEIGAGRLREAALMLGRPYEVWGGVRPGEGRGRRLGTPTANIRPLDPMKLLPAVGVYAVRVAVPGDVAPPGTPGVLARTTEALPEIDLQGELLSAAPADWAVFGGMLNFGRVPTFHAAGLPEPRIEAHLFGFAGDLRGRNVKVEWLERLRPERRFDDAVALQAQLAQDRRRALAVLGLD